MSKKKPSGAAADAPKPRRVLPGSKSQPTGPDESWRRIARPVPAFDQAVPAYPPTKTTSFWTGMSRLKSWWRAR